MSENGDMQHGCASFETRDKDQENRENKENDNNKEHIDHVSR
jgi:hypothetical protein